MIPNNSSNQTIRPELLSQLESRRETARLQRIANPNWEADFDRFMQSVHDPDFVSAIRNSEGEFELFDS